LAIPKRNFVAPSFPHSTVTGQLFQRYYQRLLHSKKSKLEESTPEINASDQEVRQENEEDEISNEHVNRIEESVDQNDYTGTLTDTVASEIGKCESDVAPSIPHSTVTGQLFNAIINFCCTGISRTT
jgi:hypothetical protein